MLRSLLLLLLSLGAGVGVAAAAKEDERLPTKCEVCKFLTVELQSALDITRRSKEVLELGEVLDNGKREEEDKVQHLVSAITNPPLDSSFSRQSIILLREKKWPNELSRETRLAEAMDNICERILQYNVHAERPGSLRYAKGTSETMMTLKNLVNKGVKVELGIPFEMWDEPSAEVTDLKKQCENMLEEYEDVVEDWYFHHQDLELERFLCVTHVLGKGDQDCLTEVWTGRKGDVDAAAGKERRAEEPGEGGEKEGEREEHWAIHNHASEL